MKMDWMSINIDSQLAFERLCHLVHVSGVGACHILQHPAEISEATEFVSAAPWLFRLGITDLSWCLDLLTLLPGNNQGSCNPLPDAVSVLSRNCHFESDH